MSGTKQSTQPASGGRPDGENGDGGAPAMAPAAPRVTQARPPAPAALGGFAPPLVTGTMYAAENTSASGPMLLSGPAFACARYPASVMRRRGDA